MKKFLLVLAVVAALVVGCGLPTPPAPTPTPTPAPPAATLVATPVVRAYSDSEWVGNPGGAYCMRPSEEGNEVVPVVLVSIFKNGLGDYCIRFRQVVGGPTLQRCLGEVVHPRWAFVAVELRGVRYEFDGARPPEFHEKGPIRACFK